MRDILVTAVALVMVIEGLAIAIRDRFTLDAISRAAVLGGIAILLLWTVGR